MKLARALGSVLFLGTLGISIQAAAWGDLGHQTVGEIAEQILSKDPVAMRSIQAIVGVEPMFMSAIWPDQVRSDDRFNDFDIYHMYNAPAPGKPEPKKSARTILSQYPNLLTDPEVPRDVKMIAYRYIVHIVGDMHQPLHAGYASDAGGNACQVKFQPDEKAAPSQTNLHSLWDTGLVELLAKRIKADRYEGFRDMAKMLLKKYPEVANEKADLDFDVWIRESQELVKTDAYPDQLGSRPYCPPRGVKITDDMKPVLGPAFAETRLPIVEKRLVLAGVRLAAFLKQLFTTMPPQQKPEYLILKMLKQTSPESDSDGHKHD